MSLIHLELLDKSRQKVLKKLSVFNKEAVLGGGTSLSLQLAHRYSYDFDLFFPRQIQRIDFVKLKKIVNIKKAKLTLKKNLLLLLIKKFK